MGKWYKQVYQTPPDPKGIERRNCNLIQIFTFQVPQTWWVVDVCWLK